jgi:hypothetical protein
LYVTAASPINSISFPSANTCPNRVYRIINRTGQPLNTNSYIDFNAGTSTSVSNNKYIEIVSDGFSWQQIGGNQ